MLFSLSFTLPFTLPFKMSSYRSLISPEVFEEIGGLEGFDRSIAEVMEFFMPDGYMAHKYRDGTVHVFYEDYVLVIDPDGSRRVFYST